MGRQMGNSRHIIKIKFKRYFVVHCISINLRGRLTVRVAEHKKRVEDGKT